MNLTGKIVVSHGADPFDAREFREMLESRAWNAFAKRLDLLISSASSACATAKDADEWRKAQGALEALQRAKMLPQMIEQDLTEGQKET